MSSPIIVREYKDVAEYQREAAQFGAAGYSASVTEKTIRSGCLRIILLGGIGALVFKPKPHLVVTYSRSQVANSPVPVTESVVLPPPVLTTPSNHLIRNLVILTAVLFLCVLPTLILLTSKP